MGVFEFGKNDEYGKACSKVLEIHGHKRKVWRDIKSIEATDARYSTISIHCPRNKLFTKISSQLFSPEVLNSFVYHA